MQSAIADLVLLDHLRLKHDISVKVKAHQIENNSGGSSICILGLTAVANHAIGEPEYHQ